MHGKEVLRKEKLVETKRLSKYLEMAESKTKRQRMGCAERWAILTGSLDDIKSQHMSREGTKRGKGGDNIDSE